MTEGSAVSPSLLSQILGKTVDLASEDKRFAQNHIAGLRVELSKTAVSASNIADLLRAESEAVGNEDK